MQVFIERSVSRRPEACHALLAVKVIMHVISTQRGIQER